MPPFLGNLVPWDGGLNFVGFSSTIGLLDFAAEEAHRSHILAPLASRTWDAPVAARRANNGNDALLLATRVAADIAMTSRKLKLRHVTRYICIKVMRSQDAIEIDRGSAFSGSQVWLMPRHGGQLTSRFSPCS
jgi:hypothetical protein